MADGNFKFDENGEEFSITVEINVGKGEIALYEQFLLFSTVFSNDFTADTYKHGLVLERVEKLKLSLTTLETTGFENPAVTRLSEAV